MRVSAHNELRQAEEDAGGASVSAAEELACTFDEFGLLVARLAAEKSPGWEQAGVSFDQMVGDFLEGTLLPSLEQAMAEPEEEATEGGRSSPAAGRASPAVG